eukprot:GDKI01017222.1.p1 GENE.GDKI01017222.1~~GDKI01017222.1.p1  ORF type:complete len:342 (-),score=77.27 GDKI01017222.1:27-1016(-)
MLRYLLGIRGVSGYGSSTKAEKVAADNQERISGRVFIVTGASAGIGLETVRVLASKGGHVIMACRGGQKAEEAYKSVVRTTPNGKVELMECDLASFESIRLFVEKFKAKKLQLNVLICNAGVMACPQALTVDGHESQFGTNHLGHFLFTNLLLDKLQQSGPNARVVILASEAHRLFLYPQKITFGNLLQTGIYHPWKAYGMSKLSNVLHAHTLQQKLTQNGYTNVTAYSVHPGAIHTDLGRHLGIFEKLMGVLCLPIMLTCMKSIPQGAATSVFCAVDPRASADVGMYFADCNVEQTKALTDKEYATLAERLWEESARITQSDVSAHSN